MHFEYLKYNGSLQKVNILNTKFEKYNLKLLEGSFKSLDPDIGTPFNKEWYIIGENMSKESRETSFDDTCILFDLLNLSKKLVDGKGFGDDDGMSGESQLLFADEIVEWCNIYGLPYVDDHLFTDTKQPIFGFSILRFKERIRALYNHFNVYYGLENNDLDFIKNNTTYEAILNFYNNDIARLKEDFANTVWGNSDINLKMKYNRKKKEYEMVPYTMDLIKIAYFQLGILMLGKTDDNIKYCSCGNLFIYKHGNQRDCPACQSMQEANRQKKYRQTRKAIEKDFNDGMSIEDIALKYDRDISRIKKWLNVE